MVAAATSRLDRRLNVHFDFTHSDVVVLTLIVIVTCPIKLEHTSCMIIFNNQCYGVDCFDHYKTSDYQRIKRRIDSGYVGHTKFKETRTGD